IELGLPVDAAVGGLPEAARREPDVHRHRILLGAFNVVEPAHHYSRTDRAEAEAAEQGIVRGVDRRGGLTGARPLREEDAANEHPGDRNREGLATQSMSGDHHFILSGTDTELCIDQSVDRARKGRGTAGYFSRYAAKSFQTCAITAGSMTRVSVLSGSLTDDKTSVTVPHCGPMAIGSNA